MNPEFVQNLRYKLQVRVRRLHAANYPTYHNVLQHFWNYLIGNIVFSSIVEELRARVPTAQEWATQRMQGSETAVDQENEHAAICSWIVEKCASETNTQVELALGHPIANSGNANECLERFHEVFVEPLYDFVDEHLDDSGAMLALLRRYQHRTEWFHRDRLFDAWTKDGSRGEKLLAMDLYEYLYEQALNFISSRPQSRAKLTSLACKQGPIPCWQMLRYSVRSDRKPRRI